MTKFLNPADVVGQADIKQGQTVADFGCGAGFYSLAAAKFVGERGSVYAVDIMPDRLAATQSAAQHAGLKNITLVKTDLEKPITGIEPSACDFVLVSNILHQVSSKEAVLRNVYSVLKTGGQVLAVEWKKGYSVFGPPQESRIGSDELVSLMEKLSFRRLREIEAGEYHYAVLFSK